MAHNRVVHPPGGPSSNIFTAEEIPITPRRVKNYMQSNLFGESSEVDGSSRPQSRQRPTRASFDHLFGETPIKQNGTTNGHCEKGYSPRNPVTGEGIEDPKAKRIVNGVNGHAQMNGNGHVENGVNGVNGVNGHNGHNGVNGTENGHCNGVGGKRVPPGGFSSKLW